jgi:hypothetical protein
VLPIMNVEQLEVSREGMPKDPIVPNTAPSIAA